MPAPKRERPADRVGHPHADSLPHPCLFCSSMRLGLADEPVPR